MEDIQARGKERRERKKEGKPRDQDARGSVQDVSGALPIPKAGFGGAMINRFHSQSCSSRQMPVPASWHTPNPREGEREGTVKRKSANRTHTSLPLVSI